MKDYKVYDTEDPIDEIAANETVSCVGCVAIIVCAIIFVLCCVTIRACSDSFNDVGEQSQYERSLLD